MSTTNGSKKYCLVCKKREIRESVWLCNNCFRYLGKQIVSEAIDECGGDYSYIPNHIPEEQHEDYFVKLLKKKREEKSRKKKMPKMSRYGYNVPSNWIQCKGCPDMVSDDISDVYCYGYCNDCTNKIPNYISTEQWGRWLDAYFKNKVL